MDSKWDNSWPLEPKRRLTHDEYTVAWLCTLGIEIAAAENVLDERHEPPPHPEADQNIYIFGSICGHNVVIGWPDIMGTTPTAILATRMNYTFRNLKFGMLVGIAAGVPENGDVRLGDVVISKRDGFSGGVVVHDRGKVTSEGFVHQSFLNGVPEVLGKAIQRLESLRRTKIKTYLSDSFKRNSDFCDFERPTKLDDNLFESGYTHIDPKDRQCLKCDKERTIKSRIERRRKDESSVLFGTVASGNQVIKTSEKRAEIAAINPGILAIEMKAAGLMDAFGCAAICGICDYADSHKNDGWHKYAAAAAAAVAKEILEIIPVAAVARNAVVPVAEPITARARGKQRRFVICGIGGYGKSEVCLKFAEQNRELFWGIFWINCSNVTSIKERFVNIARRGGVVEDMEQPQIWLQNSKDPWLLILDNADDPEIDYLKYMPSGDRGWILMSTRNPECESFSNIGDEISQKLDFEKFEFEDAVTLLLKTSGIRAKSWNEQKPDAEEVVRTLSQHALAIINAGAYIKEGLCTLQEYPEEFTKQRQNLLKLHPKQATSDYRDVHATFAISTDKIAERALTDPGYRSALELFSTLGYMHFNGLALEIWERAFQYGETEYFVDDDDDDIDYLSNWHKSRLQRFLGSTEETLSQKQLLRKGLNVLISFSLVNEQQDSRIITMHPLAHAWAKDHLTLKDQVHAWTTTAVVLAGAMGGRRYDIFWWRLGPHIGSCIQQYLQNQVLRGIGSSESHFEVFTAIYHLFLLLHWEDDCATALDSFESIQKHLGSGRRSTNWLLLQHWIANCVSGLGDSSREPSLREEIKKYSQDFQNKYMRWRLNRRIGECYVNNGQYEEALRLFKVQYHEMEGELSFPNTRFSLTAAQIARTYKKMGRRRKARKIYEKILRESAGKVDITDPHLLDQKYDLGVIYLQGGMNTQATNMLENVVKIEIEILAPTYSGLLLSQRELAKAYAASGAYDKAIEIMEKVVEIGKKTKEASNPERLDREEKLGEFHIKNKSSHQAIGLLEEVVRIRKQELKSSYSSSLYSRTLLGNAYLRNGSNIEAISNLEENLTTDLRENPCSHLDCLELRWNLALSYWIFGRKNDALKLLEEVMPLLAEEMKPTHPIREDFERLFERCQTNPNEPLGTEFDEHQDWAPKIPDEASETSSISSIDDESTGNKGSGDEDSGDEGSEDEEEDSGGVKL